MRQILITAFEPFGQRNINTSAEVLGLLPQCLGGTLVHKALLPVVFGRAAEAALAAAGDAEAIFLLGEAGGRQAVTPEEQAVNLRDARLADNAGAVPRQEAILPEGPPLYRTPLPVARMVSRLRQEGLPLAVSRDAGTFVCNDTYYLVGVHSPVPVCFIHVPAQEAEAPSWAAAVQAFVRLAVLRGEE